MKPILIAICIILAGLSFECKKNSAPTSLNNPDADQNYTSDLTNVPNQKHLTYDQALALWSSFNIHDYTMRQRCHTWMQLPCDTMNIIVHADTITSICHASGEPLDSCFSCWYKPINQLFDRISRWKDADTAEYTLTVEYDTLLGYPVNLGICSRPPNGPTDFLIIYRTCCLTQ